MSEQLEIRTEFQNLIPPLSLEELNGLEDSIKKEGCRDPLVVWNNTIIDGHHRYAICTKHTIPFETIENYSLKTEVDVKIWIIQKELSKYNCGRRLSAVARIGLAYKWMEIGGEKCRN